MGCGSSTERKRECPPMAKEDKAVALFTARCRNAGVSKEFLATHPESDRKNLVKDFGFDDAEAEDVYSNWHKIQKQWDEEQTKQEGIALREKLDLPQQDSEQHCKDRVTEIKYRRMHYQWTFPVEGGYALPPYVAKIPSAEKVGAAHAVNLFANFQQKKASLHLNKVMDMVHNTFNKVFNTKEDPFKDYADLYRTTKTPRVASTWKNDEEFGQQRFNGINPMLIRCVDPQKGLPSKFPVTDELVKNLLPAGQSLNTLIQHGRLFICDCDELDGIPAPEENNLCAPLALFFVDDRKKLMPCAIQLHQSPGPSNPIFTPDPAHTHPGAWLVARTHFQVADGILHEVTSHYCACHAYLEVIYISMMRNMSVWHPVSELVRPHFWFTMVLQDSARKSLISPDGPVARLMACGATGMNALLSKSFKEWRFTRFELPARMKRRGIEDSEKIPGLYYRDDGMRLWDIIERFVKDLVSNFYPEVKLLREDHELQNWMKELVEDLKLKDLPVDPATNKITEPKQLILFLTSLIFAATAGHSMVNNGQWDYFGFIPNSPGTFKMKPPTSVKQEITEGEIAAKLPSYSEAADQITVVHTLSSKPPKTIGQYQASFMTGRPAVRPFMHRFQDELSALSKSIQERNKELEAKGEISYPYLDPATVSNCVDV